VKFKVPDDAKEGAKYDVKWASLAIESGDMVRLIPNKTNGYILVKTDMDITEPDSTEPDSTEPDTTTEPVTTEPDSTEPDSTEPESTEPVSTEPDSTEPVSTEPDSTEPVSTEPDSTEPVSTEPDSTEPVSTEPDSTEPVSTEPDSTEPVSTEPQEDTTEPQGDTTEPQGDTTEPESTEPTTDPKDNPENWPKDGRDSNVTWIIKDVEKEVSDAPVTVDVPVIVTNDEYGLNSYIANIALEAEGQTVMPVAVKAAQGSAYNMTFKDNNKDMQYAGTAADNQPAAKNEAEVFIVTFQFDTLEGIHFTEVDGKLKATYEVIWNGDANGDGLQIIHAGDAKIKEYPINHKVQDGSITLIKDKSEEQDYDKYEYKYYVDGSDMFFFAHDPRLFSDILPVVKVYRRGVYNDSSKPDGDWIALKEEDVTEYAVVTTAGGYKSPADAYLNGGADSCYAGLPLTITFKDGENVVTLDASSEIPFDAKAFIGVKGDADLDGLCNANDATAILLYAAAVGTNTADQNPLANKSGAELKLAMFLADVDGEETSEEDRLINAADATSVQIFAAKFGTSAVVDNTAIANIWVENLEPVPPYTKTFADYLKDNKE
jgi:hypothetical protein